MDVAFLADLPAQDLSVLKLFGLVILAMLMARLITIPRQYDPLYWFGELARQMANKVSHPSRGAPQQYIAGTLAILLLVLPFWSIVIFIPILAAYPWFFEFLILYLCFNTGGLNSQLQQVANAINKQQTADARALIAPWVPQSVTRLSDVGLSKTAIELTLTLPTVRLIGVALAYFVAGPALALLLRMLTELARQWPTQAPDFVYFGRPVELITRLLMFIPVQIWTLLLALQGGPAAMASIFRPKPAELDACLPVGANVLQLELGGPQMFGEAKVRLPKTGPAILPQAQDIVRAIGISRTATGYFSVLLICLPLLWVTVRLYGH